MTAHAKLSASGSHRWLNCPASVSREEALPESTSVFAEEGTAAHELAEACLAKNLDAYQFLGQTFNGFEVDQEMADAVQMYLDYVRDQEGHKLFEQRVDFSLWVPGGFGTCDCFVLNSDIATVADLKYGKGVRVDAEDNTQMMLYALGCLSDFEFMFNTIETFKLVIVQPRMDHISEWEISRDDLLAFGDVVEKRAKLALGESPTAIPGEKQCRFCNAKATCRELAEHCLQTAAEGFESVEQPIVVKDPQKLDNTEIAALLPQLKLLESWVKALEAYALAELEQGREVPGHKLVEGRSIRKWADEDAAEQALRGSKLKVAEIFTKKLVTPTQAEKLLGKNHPLLDELVVKPKGKPAIAVESDKRPAIEIDVTDGFDEVA